MMQAPTHPFACFLSGFLVLALLGCPSDRDDDTGDDDVADDDSVSDDDAGYIYSGTIISMSTNEPVGGAAIEVGSVSTTSGEDGAFEVELAEPPPQPFTLVESDVEASTEISCGTEKDITLFDTNWDAYPDVQIELHIHGLIDPSSFKGEWRSRVEYPDGGYSTSGRWVEGHDLVSVGDGEYVAEFIARCMETWSVVGTVLEAGALTSFAANSGDFLGCGKLTVDLTPDDLALTSVTWDGSLEPDATNVEFYEFVNIGENSMPVTLWIGDSPGESVEFPMVVVDDDAPYIGATIELENLYCAFALGSQGFPDVEAGETLSLLPALEPIAIVPSDGAQSFSYRPDLEFPDLPADADYFYGSVWAYTSEPNFEQAVDWRFTSFDECTVSSLSYPIGLADVPPGATGNVALYYAKEGQIAGCVTLVEWSHL